MTCRHDFTLPTELLEQRNGQGLEGLPEMIRVLVNEAVRLERQSHLRARLYERTDRRRGYANGYKPKKVTHALALHARACVQRRCKCGDQRGVGNGKSVSNLQRRSMSRYSRKESRFSRKNVAESNPQGILVLPVGIEPSLNAKGLRV